MKGVVKIAVLGVLALVACGDDESGLPDAAALSGDGVRHMSPSYSPDGKRLAWWAPGTDSLGEWQLWIGNADLSAAVRLPVRGFTTPVVWSPDGTRIAAASTLFGASQTVVVPVAGGVPKRVTSGSGVDYPLAWYPGGDRLAYYASAEGGTFRSFVVSMRTGASTPAVPGENRAYVSWPSPDGLHIAYEVWDGPRSTIWLADSAGGNPRELTTEGFEGFGYSPWSPDGTELLYESRRTGTRDLWVVPIDGGKARQLTRDVRNDRGGRWSGDGKFVAFISDRGRQTDVWVVPAAGGIERRITDSRLRELAPSWRPGTNELAFVVWDETSGIWALDLADGRERRLTPDSIRTWGFYVSPDGRLVDYVIDRGGGVHDLAVVPFAGGTSRILVEGGGTVSGPRWSPDGSRIVFTSDRAGTHDVWIVDVASGALRQLVSWPSWEWDAHWNHNGSAVLFISDRDSRLADVWQVPAAGGEPVRVTDDGAVSGGITTRPGVREMITGTINPRGGQLGISRVRSDGNLQPIWDATNAFAYSLSPSGDSLVAEVEQADGQMRSMLLSTSGGGGRVLLKPGEFASAWSFDGSMLLYTMSVGGARELGVLRVGDGSTRRLTTTAETERGAEFTPDDKSVVFSRSRSVYRIFTTDLSRFLTDGR